MLVVLHRLEVAPGLLDTEALLTKTLHLKDVLVVAQPREVTVVALRARPGPEMPTKDVLVVQTPALQEGGPIAH